MFNSGISVKELIDELNNEVDIALDIPEETYISWLNSLQQLLYTEVIKEQRETYVTLMSSQKLKLSFLSKGENESTPLFEDIVAIFAGKRQLKKSTVASGKIFDYTFYKENNDIGYNLEKSFDTKEFTVIHIVRPDLASKQNMASAKVMLPIEFIDLARAKLRGEAYKLANEENLAAKWLNDYNILLETFKAWIAEKAPNFGL